MPITDVALVITPFSTGTWLDEQRVSTPLSWFPRFTERRSSWRGPGADLVSVMIETDDGAFGLGQTRGGAVVAALIESHFAPLLVGQDAGTIHRRIDELRRAALPYAVGGVSALATAAVELALWDLVARRAGMPLTRLLGGHHEPLPYYVTCADPEAPLRMDSEFLFGARAVKIPAQWGPVDGAAGLTRTVEAIERLREILPADLPIAIDCFMSWDLEFASRVAAAAGDLGLTWIEEPLYPTDLAGYSELRRRVAPVRIAGGEHLFELGDALAFVAGGCADILQIDLTWFGGLRNGLVAAAVAEAAGMVFAPHGGALQPWAVHVVAACGPSALVEVLVGVDGSVPEVPRATTGPGIGVPPESMGFAPQ